MLPHLSRTPYSAGGFWWAVDQIPLVFSGHAPTRNEIRVAAPNYQEPAGSIRNHLAVTLAALSNGQVNIITSIPKNTGSNPTTFTTKLG